MARFFDKAVPNGVGDDGLQAYETRTYLDNHSSASNRIIRPARDVDFKRWPKAYEEYLASREPDQDGFPLSAWTQLSESARQSLAARGIHTIEKFVDSDMSRAPKELQEALPKARAFLQRIHDEAPQLAARMEALEDEKRALKEENKELRDQVGTLEAELKEARKKVDQIDAVSDGDDKPAKRGPGRPPKNGNDD